jgi:hypothetical protein
LKAKIDHLSLNLQSAALDHVSEALELNRGRTTHSKEVKFAADPSSIEENVESEVDDKKIKPADKSEEDIEDL